MLAARLVSGGGGAAAGIAGCAICAGLLYAYRKRVPHPTEFALFGKPALWCGCHNHQSFGLMIEVHEGKNIPKGVEAYVFVESGRFEKQTEDIVSSNSLECEWHQRLQIPVRQKDDTISVSIWKRGTLQSELLGEIELNVVTDLIDNDFPLKKWYQLKLAGRNTQSLHMSFRKMPDMGGECSPLMAQALIQAQYDAEAEGKKVDTNWQGMDEKARLKFLSRVLEGPLMKMKSVGGWQELYFKAVEAKPNVWEWHYWKSKTNCTTGKAKAGTIPLLGISIVLPDKNDRHQFYVKSHDSGGVHNLFFKRIDRDRDIWSDGLYEFLEKLRAYLEKYPIQTKVESHLEAKFGKQQRRPSRERKKSKDFSNVTTVAGPMQKQKPVKNPGVAPPDALSKMLNEGMGEIKKDDADD